MSTKEYLLNDVPEDLWAALRADAASRETPQDEKGRRLERTGTSLNNVVGEVLAARYELEFQGTNRATFDQTPVNRSLYLRLPEDLMDAVKEEAGRAYGSKRIVILQAIADHYLMSVPVYSWPSGKPAKKKHGRPRGRKAKR